jgi:glucose/arabinose dehydrogenase
VGVRLVRVASIRNAVGMAAPPGASRIFVASRGGRIYALDEGSEPRKVLDLAREVSCCEEEQGMFDLAAEPDGSALYASFSDTTGALRVVSIPMVLGRLETGSRQDLISIPQASPRHHGGSLEIGPDGHLFIGTGDGVLDLEPRNRAQSFGSLRGKLLRIDPDAGGETYAIPSSNPFLDRPRARPEIFARGLRNPWRFSFDRANGDLWLADVGRYEVEEINFLPARTGAGTNLGWDRMEGTRRVRGRPPRDHTPPVFEYAHRGGRCAVIGGYVYRGSAIPKLEGVYLFGDLCDGRVRTLRVRNGRVTRGPPLNVRVDALVSFGEDAAGEIYLLSLYRGIYRLEPSV